MDSPEAEGDVDVFLSRFGKCTSMYWLALVFACCIKLCVLECVLLIVLLIIHLMWSVNCVIYVIYVVWRVLIAYVLILGKLWFLAFKESYDGYWRYFMVLLLKDFHGFRRVLWFVVWRIFMILGVDLRVWKFYNLIWFPEEKVLWFCHLLMDWEILWFCCRFWLFRSFMISILICEFKGFRNLWMIYFKICLWLILRDV